MSDQFSSSNNVKRYGSVPSSIHPERSSRLSIWLWIGAAVVGVAMALPDSVFGETLDRSIPVSGPVSDFGALPTNPSPEFGDVIGRSSTATVPGIDATLGRTATMPGEGGSEGGANAADTGPAAPDGWDRPEPGAHAGPESIGGPSQP